MTALDALVPMSGPIRDLFGGGNSDPTSFTAGTGNGGKAPGSGQLAPEGIDKSQNSLDQYTRSLTNYTGQTGQDTFKTGQDTFKSGQGNYDSGKSALQPVMDYFDRLLHGDRASVASAMQPQADPISQQFGEIRKMFAQTGARGGGTTSTLAQSPFTQQRELADLASQQRSTAATQQGGLAMGEAGLGLSESNLGISQSSLGNSMLNETIQALLGRRGQNVQVDMNNINNLTKGLESVLGTPLSDMTGILLGRIPGMTPQAGGSGN